MEGKRHSGPGGATINKQARVQIMTPDGFEMFASVSGAAKKAHFLITGQKTELNGWEALKFKGKKLSTFIEKLINPDDTFVAITGPEERTSEDLPITAKILTAQTFTEHIPDDVNTYLHKSTECIMKGSPVTSSVSSVTSSFVTSSSVTSSSVTSSSVTSSSVVSSSAPKKKKNVFRFIGMHGIKKKKAAQTFSLDPTDAKELSEAQDYYPRYVDEATGTLKPVKYSFSGFDEEDVLVASKPYKKTGFDLVSSS